MRTHKTLNGTNQSESGLPDAFPQLMAIPVTNSPLFPGFLKSITIANPGVVAAINDCIDRKRPYIAIFLSKNGLASNEVIHNVNDVYEVGVLAEVTSLFPVLEDPESMTMVLYPHCRIRLASLTSSSSQLHPVDTKDQPQLDNISHITSVQPKHTASKEEQAAFPKTCSVSIANIETASDLPYDSEDVIIQALTTEISNVLNQLAASNSSFQNKFSPSSMTETVGGVSNFKPAKLADFVAAVSSVEHWRLQEVLACFDIGQRLKKALVILKEELANTQLQAKIKKEAESRMTKRQRDYWLLEQMKGIQKELGIESNGRAKLVEELNAKADGLAMPELARKVFDDEVSKLSSLEPTASEYGVTRNYLDWITRIPWGQQSIDEFDIQHATAVLNENHYGLDDVKDRILEFIAVARLRGASEGKILCFVGPPGVGKTSIGKSIARVLNRKYYRFSVGGLTDVSEVKGHRRTYVGALPGRVIQALKQCQTENPLILIDEIDKIGHHGGLSHALLELLDLEQNSSFLDHYLDIPVDLSKVLFICTANSTDTIPGPLLDRMEVIQLSGYLTDEKIAIAEKYIDPAARNAAGLHGVNVHLGKDALEELVESYARESGVRNLKALIEKVYRKSALNIVRTIGKGTTSGTEAVERASDTSSEIGRLSHLPLSISSTTQISISKDNLASYVGPPVFISDRPHETNPVGVATGLAWTQLGGAAMYVESILQSPLDSASKPSLEITGNLQPVMKESSRIAYSFARNLLAKKFPGTTFFNNAQLHLHIPDGAVSKDGPSAGVTMTTSLISLALDARVPPSISMTGELTLTGKVLRIGGLREKTVAARRNGCTTVIFPRDNLSDWLELPDNIKQNIDGKPVSWYSEIFDIIFPEHHYVKPLPATNRVTRRQELKHGRRRNLRFRPS
ncbi:ATP-dependent Lon protease pim1 [Fusarium oxysporum]|nr:ATP-dependent Lon protease pim1 [Fusarium oxysporum]KAJ4073569.1 ATP-dependent Lon protease pim1 [Fusarium oxysporum]WKT52787.1 hypothetical protein QSH57_003349 [Fusarium oxysporum f. sp. vasinfectum]